MVGLVTDLEGNDSGASIGIEIPLERKMFGF